MSDTLTALQVLLDNGLPEASIVPIVNDLLSENALEDDYDFKRLVLLAVRSDRESDVDCAIEVTKYDDCTFEAGGNEYMVLDEDEKESRWDDYLDSLLDDCIEGADNPYFDREKWKRDARMDGAGHSLNPYDGSEEEYHTGNAWLYIYRTN